MGSACGPLEALSCTSSSASTHSDDLQRVLASAPWWLYSTTWKVAKPENLGAELSSFKVTGPVSSDEMMQLYRAKKLKGSVLMTGLTQTAKEMRPQDVPASLFRTLAHLFEMSRNGVPYSPVDLESAKSGKSAASWARPLWTICEPSVPNGLGGRAGGSPDSNATEHSIGGASSVAESLGSCDATGLNDGRPCTPAPEETDLTIRLLKSAPMWCYLYSHEPLKSKKTPPKTSAHMVDMYRSGCLPEWTPLLGLQTEVAHFNSLPPSLFTTLGALVSVLKAGLELQPVGLVELQRYDKFIEQRNHVGNTMRVPSVDNLRASGVLRGARPRGALASTRSTPTDNLSRALSSLPPLGSRNATTSTTPVSCSSSVTSTAARVPPPPPRSPAPSPWAVPHTNGPAPNGAAADSAADASAHGATALPPYGMAMPMYPAMMPWMWGMPHVPYTLLPSPTQPAAGPPANARSSPTTPSVSRRTTGNPHRNNASGGRVGMTTQTTPGGVANGAAYRGQYQTTPSRATHAAAPPGESPQTPMSPFVVSPGLGTPGGHPMLMPMVADPTAAAAAMQAGLWPWGMPPMMGMPGGLAAGPSAWSTSVFKLFMADSSRGAGQPVWWYYDGRHPAHTVGPVPAESMILAYASGNITPHHYLCGTTAEVTTVCPPAKEFFEDLGSLLKQIENGGHYMLVTLEEVTEHAKRASGNGVQSAKQGSARARRSRSNAPASGPAQGNTPVPPKTPKSLSSPRQEPNPSSSGDMGGQPYGESSETSSQSALVSPGTQQILSPDNAPPDEVLFASSAATAAAAAAAAVVSLLDKSDTGGAEGDATRVSPMRTSRVRADPPGPAPPATASIDAAQPPIANGIAHVSSPFVSSSGKSQGATKPVNGRTPYVNGVVHANGINGVTDSGSEEDTDGSVHARQRPCAGVSAAVPVDAGVSVDAAPALTAA